MDIKTLKERIEALQRDVTRFSELADERHDLLSAERRENGELRFQRAQLSGRVEQLRQCLVDVGKENAALREQLAQARATAFKDAIEIIGGVEETDPECNTWTTDCIRALEAATTKQPGRRWLKQILNDSVEKRANS